MTCQRLFTVFCVGLLVSACSANGERAANEWIKSQAVDAKIDSIAPLPPIMDTPSAAYTAKAVVDPFLPGRITKTRMNETVALTERSGKVHFAETALDALRVVGFLEVQGQYVCVLEGASGYGNAKIGDRLGRQQAEIVAISAKGIRLQQTDGVESWMPISRRSR